jgi:hypothetical protein
MSAGSFGRHTDVLIQSERFVTNLRDERACSVNHGIHEPSTQDLRFGTRERRNERGTNSGTPDCKRNSRISQRRLQMRQKRNPHILPTAYDQLFIRYQRSWKGHGHTQPKNAGNINRRIRSPPFCDS